MKRTDKKSPEAPRTLHRDLLAKRNRALPLQTRKMLAQHYSAKYRVHRTKG